MFYTGVGSRRTPLDIQTTMTRVALHLAGLGYWLRSGHATGADVAFEVGAGSRAEIYKPWPSFNAALPTQGIVYAKPDPRVFAIAALAHPNWGAVDKPGRLLHGRNVHQVLGIHLDLPSLFLLCWTPDGAASGGTGQAIRLAETYAVPVFNLYWANVRERLETMMRSHD